MESFVVKFPAIAASCPHHHELLYCYICCVDQRYVSQEEDCKKMVDTAVEKFGALHVAFNNAGIFRTSSFVDMTEDTVGPLLDVNVKSLVWCFKYQVCPHTKLCWCSTNEPRDAQCRVLQFCN